MCWNAISYDQFDSWVKSTWNHLIH
jgi:hypothetical protein